MHRVDKKWHLGFKGIIATLLIQDEPKVWNPQWKGIFDAKAKVIEQQSTPFLENYGINKKDIRPALKHMGLCLDDFNAWVGLSKVVKSMMEQGIINFDLIKDSTLLGLIIMETKVPEVVKNLDSRVFVC